MAQLPPPVRRATRDHPLITLGIVMGVLLACLLALPFLPRAHPRATRPAASSADARIQAN